MKCRECPDYAKCVKESNLAIKRRTCKKTKIKYVMNNADRIRSMNDEELAKFIDDIAQSVADGEYCTAFLNVKNFPYSCEDTKKACVAHVVEWLQQPAEGDDHD